MTRHGLVFDTSTLIGAVLKPQSLPARALSWAWEVGDLLVSAETLQELHTVLERPRLDAFRPVQARREFFALYAAAAVRIETVPAVTACRDPKDDKFLALAAAAGASLLVSSDADLLSMGDFQGIKIVSPRQFVALCE